VEGGYTRDFTQPDGQQSTIYDASVHYAQAGHPARVLAGAEYGSGSSRDWAAKGTALLGRAGRHRGSFERIHRSNLIGMGVHPAAVPGRESADVLGLDGDGDPDIGHRPSSTRADAQDVTVRSPPTEAGPRPGEFDASCGSTRPVRRTTTATAGILPYVLRNLLRGEA
jgi:aconitate hydratase